MPRFTVGRTNTPEDREALGSSLLDLVGPVGMVGRTVTKLIPRMREKLFSTLKALQNNRAAKAQAVVDVRKKIKGLENSPLGTKGKQALSEAGEDFAKKSQILRQANQEIENTVKNIKELDILEVFGKR